MLWKHAAGLENHLCCDVKKTKPSFPEIGFPSIIQVSSCGAGILPNPPAVLSPGAGNRTGTLTCIKLTGRMAVGEQVGHCPSRWVPRGSCPWRGDIPIAGRGASVPRDPACCWHRPVPGRQPCPLPAPSQHRHQLHAVQGSTRSPYLWA